jgi:TonB family protein
LHAPAQPEVLNLIRCFRLLSFDCPLVCFTLTGLETAISLYKKLRGTRHPESLHHEPLTADSRVGIKEEMILATASGVRKPERFDLYVEKLRSICDMHGVGTGSRDNLYGLLQRLEEDRRFSMDFWGLVGKLSDREGGELSDEQMLVVVVAGVTGDETLDENDTRFRDALHELRALLSGVDLHQMEPLTTARAVASMQRDPLRPKWSSLAPSLVPQEPANAGAGQSGALQKQLEQTIQRLELVNRQLVQSLAYLDERFRRLESQFELSPPPSTAQYESLVELSEPEEQSLPPVEHAGASPDKPDLHQVAPVEEELILHPEPHQAAEAPLYEEPGDLLHVQDAKPRLVLEPIAPPTEVPLAPMPNKGHSGPLFELYAPESGSNGKKIAAGSAIVLLLAGSGFAWMRYNTQIRQTTAGLIQRIHPTEAAPAATQSQAEPVDATQDGAAGQTAQPPAEQTIAPAVTPSAPPPAPPAEQPHKTTPDRASANVAQDAFTASNSSAVRVPAGVMEKNLIVSSVPVYPAIAKASRVQGSVVVQALITKTGVVSRIHVAQGDTRLRTAAIDAIYRQRYRPYVVNGVPVDVVTTITMNFTPSQ